MAPPQIFGKKSLHFEFVIASLKGHLNGTIDHRGEEGSDLMTEWGERNGDIKGGYSLQREGFSRIFYFSPPSREDFLHCGGLDLPGHERPRDPGCVDTAGAVRGILGARGHSRGYQRESERS